VAQRPQGFYGAVQQKPLTQRSMIPYMEPIATEKPLEREMSTRTTAKAAAAENATLDVANVMQEATAKVESFVADTQKTVTEQFEKLSKGFEGLTTFGQENVDALVKSSEIAAKAAEGIGTEISAYSKKSFEDGVAAAQDFASAKTLTELFEKQTTYAQTAFEGFVSQATKMNEIYVAAAKDISAPLGARVTAATEALKSFSL
jgi:phasin family protein